MEMDKEHYFRHLDMKAKMHGILGKAIREMRACGATEQDVVKTLRWAASKILSESKAAEIYKTAKVDELAEAYGGNSNNQRNGE
jgi:hypothetical protein